MAPITQHLATTIGFSAATMTICRETAQLWLDRYNEDAALPELQEERIELIGLPRGEGRHYVQGLGDLLAHVRGVDSGTDFILHIPDDSHPYVVCMVVTDRTLLDHFGPIDA
jgi:hypothetical protein